jgi:hypothetical protein
MGLTRGCRLILFRGGQYSAMIRGIIKFRPDCTIVNSKMLRWVGCVCIREYEEYTQNFDQETCLEVPTWNIVGWEDNIKNRARTTTILVDLCRTGNRNSYNSMDACFNASRRSASLMTVVFPDLSYQSWRVPEPELKHE